MPEDIAAIDIGERWITVARLMACPTGGYRLLHAGLVTAPEKLDDAELVKLLRRYWRRNRLPTRTVCAGFRSRSVSIKNFEFPHMTDSELSSALRLEASELLALNQDEIVWDWQRTPASDSDPAARSEGVLVAAPRHPVEVRLRLLRDAGLYPVRMETPSLAVARLIGNAPDGPRPDETMAVLNLGGEQADIVVLSQANIFPRTVYVDDEGWEDHPDELTAHLVDAIRYAQYSLRHGPVHRLYVTGWLRDPAELVDHLAKHTRLSVELWDPVERLHLQLRSRWPAAATVRTMPTALTSCLGLALPTN